jgi:parallel beta-helix repeat protein
MHDIFIRRARTNRKGTKVLIGSLTLALGVFGMTATASAAPLACGQVLTTSVTLQANLNCSGYIGGPFALAAGAANITINLNGYTITGPGTSFIEQGVIDGAILAQEGFGQPGFNNVVVKNGVINGFVADTAAAGVSGWTVTGITSAPSSLSFSSSAYLVGTSDANVSNDVFTGPSDGYGVFSKFGSSGTSVSGVTISGTAQGIVSLSGVTENYVNNDILKSGTYGIYSSADNSLLVAGNTFTPGGPGAIGIYDYGSQNSTWRNNTAYGFATGIETYDGIDNQWNGNVSNTDTSDGVDEYSDNGSSWTDDTFNNEGGHGVYSDGSSGTWTNPSISAAALDGMVMVDFAGSIIGGTSNRSPYDGIFLEDPAGVTLDNNTTSRDGYSGTYIGTGTAETTVENSTANNNSLYGFYSEVPTAGTNNTADSNVVGNCVNVSCTS